MNLQPLPRAAVERAYEEHAVALGKTHDALEASVQEVAARWDDRYPRPGEMFSGAFASNVRLTFRQVAPPLLKGTSLRHEEVALGGQRLRGRGGHFIRVRKRPRLPRRAQHIGQQTVVPDGVDLLGEEFVDLNYELMVLWSVDEALKSLRSAVLAAVSDIDEPQKVRIHHEIALPVPRPAHDQEKQFVAQDEDFGDEDFDDEDGVGQADS